VGACAPGYTASDVITALCQANGNHAVTGLCTPLCKWLNKRQHLRMSALQLIKAGHNLLIGRYERCCMCVCSSVQFDVENLPTREGTVGDILLSV
jgi:hypothetical protein